MVVCGSTSRQENSVNYSRFLAIKYAPAIPRVGQAGFSALSAGGVTLHGWINPHGNATQAYFEYGLTETYGAVAAVTLANDQAMTPQEVGAVVAGLASHETYHFRLVAWNEHGTVVSPDATFFTSAPPQTVDDGVFTLTSSGAATLDVLANDREPEGESFQLVAVGAPWHGVASRNGSGTAVSYDPADEYAGLDSFTYTVADGHGAAAMATVTVRVPDTRLPVIGMAGPFTLYSGLNNLAALPDFLSQVTMTDNVGVTSFAQSPRAGTLLRPGVSTVRLTALDAAGNAGVRDISVLVRKGSGGVETLGRSGALLPPSLATGGLAGSRWVSFETPALSAAGDVAFTARWSGPAGSGEALFRQDAAGTRVLLRKGQTMRDQARLLAMNRCCSAWICLRCSCPGCPRGRCCALTRWI